MREREQSLAVAADRRIEHVAGIEHVRSVDFLGLMEGFRQAKVRRVKLRLVQIVINGLSGDGVTKPELHVLLVVDKPLTGRVVELRLTAFGLQLRESQVPHFGGALEGQFGVELGENLVVLAWNLLIFSCYAAQSRQEQIFDCG